MLKVFCSNAHECIQVGDHKDRRADCGGGEQVSPSLCINPLCKAGTLYFGSIPFPVRVDDEHIVIINCRLTVTGNRTDPTSTIHALWPLRFS